MTWNSYLTKFSKWGCNRGSFEIDLYSPSALAFRKNDPVIVLTPLCFSDLFLWVTFPQLLDSAALPVPDPDKDRPGHSLTTTAKTSHPVLSLPCIVLALLLVPQRQFLSHEPSVIPSVGHTKTNSFPICLLFGTYWAEWSDLGCWDLWNQASGIGPQ